jgi:hypothetical protein
VLIILAILAAIISIEVNSVTPHLCSSIVVVVVLLSNPRVNSDSFNKNANISPLHSIIDFYVIIKVRHNYLSLHSTTVQSKQSGKIPFKPDN